MLFVAMVCGGCTPWAHRYQLASSGTVGCAPEQIQISDHARGAGVESWRATCGGEVYACSAASQRGAALCTAVASRPSSAASVAEARRPQLDVTRQGDRVQRVTAVFRTYEGTVTLTFSPEVSAELVVLTFTPRTTSRARACDNFSMESSVGSALRVALVEGAASVPLRELLAAGQGHVRARICGRSPQTRSTPFGAWESTPRKRFALMRVRVTPRVPPLCLRIPPACCARACGSGRP